MLLFLHVGLLHPTPSISSSPASELRIEINREPTFTPSLSLYHLVKYSVSQLQLSGSFQRRKFTLFILSFFFLWAGFFSDMHSPPYSQTLELEGRELPRKQSWGFNPDALQVLFRKWFSCFLTIGGYTSLHNCNKWGYFPSPNFWAAWEWLWIIPPIQKFGSCPVISGKNLWSYCNTSWHTISLNRGRSGHVGPLSSRREEPYLCSRWHPCFDSQLHFQHKYLGTSGLQASHYCPPVDGTMS